MGEEQNDFGHHEQVNIQSVRENPVVTHTFDLVKWIRTRRLQ